jgi:hypothetical protein
MSFFPGFKGLVGNAGVPFTSLATIGF